MYRRATAGDFRSFSFGRSGGLWLRLCTEGRRPTFLRPLLCHVIWEDHATMVLVVSWKSFGGLGFFNVLQLLIAPIKAHGRSPRACLLHM